MGVLSQVDLDDGAAELHVGIAHPPGEPAVPQGSQGPWLLVFGPFLAFEVGVGLLVVRGQLVQAVQNVLLEYLEQQGESDLSAF